MSDVIKNAIANIIVNQDNLSHIMTTGKINGSLLVDIETVIKDELFVERQLVKVKQKQIECKDEEIKQLKLAVTKTLELLEGNPTWTIDELHKYLKSVSE